MRKLRLYLDTSVISDIDAPLGSGRGAITKEFFRIVTEKTDVFELLISPVTKEELDDSPEEKQIRFAAFLRSFPHTMLPESEEADKLAWLYVVEDVLADNHINDLTHVAYAVTARCDYIISWNMKHLVRAQTISRVNDVNMLNNFPRVFIATPSLITGDLNHEND